MTKSAWNDLEAVLGRYLAQHGRQGTTKDNTNPAGTGASVAALTSRSPR